MAQGLNKTKRRIVSVTNTKKITEAMELVATVKLKKFKKVMENNEAYSCELENLISCFFEMLEPNEENIYLNSNKDAKELVVIISSNLGLCASYNSNIISFVKSNIAKDNSVILPIGLKANLSLHKEGYEINESFVSLNEKISYEDCVKLSRFIHSEFVHGKYSAIKILYTKYINSLKFEPYIKTILPLNKINNKVKIGYSPIFDPNVKTLIDELVPIELTSTIYQLLIESQVSEQASRRNAMENANDNAEEIINKLTLEYNKARQAAITQEITEVTASQSK